MNSLRLLISKGMARVTQALEKEIACPKCYEMNAGHLEHCAYCGASLIENRPTKTIVCPTCGSTIEPRATRCPICAAKVDRVALGVVCPECGSDIEPGLSRCPVCNTKLRKITLRMTRKDLITVAGCSVIAAIVLYGMLVSYGKIGGLPYLQIHPNTNLSSQDWSGKDLEERDLSHSNLSNTKFQHANLSHVDFHNALLSNADFRDADLSNADFTNANLFGADFSGAELRRTRLDNLSGVTLANVDLFGEDMAGLDSPGGNLAGANLRGSDISNSNLSGANLKGANLSSCDLSNSDLSGAHLDETQLTNALLTNANLSGAILTNTDLSESNLSGADVTNAHFDNTDLSHTTLIGAKGLTQEQLNKSVNSYSIHIYSDDMVEDWALLCKKGGAVSQEGFVPYSILPPMVFIEGDRFAGYDLPDVKFTPPIDPSKIELVVCVDRETIFSKECDYRSLAFGYGSYVGTLEVYYERLTVVVIRVNDARAIASSSVSGLQVCPSSWRFGGERASTTFKPTDEALSMSLKSLLLLRE